jgi:hypothetical protein
MIKRLDIFTEVFLNIQDFRDVTQCRLSTRGAIPEDLHLQFYCGFIDKSM